MKNLSRLMVLTAAVLLLAGNSYAGKREKLNKEFEAKETVDISTTSGDCIILQGSADKILVQVEYSVHPKEAFNPVFKERKSTLKINERWSGSSSGEVIWTITVPENTMIEFSTASGDFSIEDAKNDVDISTASGDVSIDGVSGEFNVSTASGDIEADDVSGELDMSTASGDIEIDNSRGLFELSCASGDIQASGITITEESSFSTASGDVEVDLAKTAEYDLDLSAASGDVSLDYNGNEMKGYFELTAKKRWGGISSSVEFDGEEEFERHGRTYVRKNFTAGPKEPQINISTASGEIELKK